MIDKYTKIHNEVLEALMKMNLSPYEWRVLSAIMRKTYGWNKKEDRISLSQFSTMTELDTATVARTIRRMKEKQIILSKKIGYYQVNKKTILNLGVLAVEPVAVKPLATKPRGTGCRANRVLAVEPDTKDTITKDTKTKDIYIHDTRRFDMDIIKKFEEKYQGKKKFLDWVYMTKEQHTQLIKDMGLCQAGEMIERLNDYIWQIGPKKAMNKYDSHYHTMKNWHRKDNPKQQEKSFIPKSKEETVPALTETTKEREKREKFEEEMRNSSSK